MVAHAPSTSRRSREIPSTVPRPVHPLATCLSDLLQLLARHPVLDLCDNMALHIDVQCIRPDCRFGRASERIDMCGEEMVVNVALEGLDRASAFQSYSHSI